jgi:hypothetical protein
MLMAFSRTVYDGFHDERDRGCAGFRDGKLREADYRIDRAFSAFLLPFPDLLSPRPHLMG